MVKIIISVVCLHLVSRLFAVTEDSTNQEERVVDLKPWVVTSAREEIPLVLELDASAAIQPIPAQDGADFLKHIPGFSIIRKGGTDGDPVLRGAGGSRICVCVDGETILGGCGQRMDPPTAYVFPTSFDRVIVMKGPQSVVYGPGNSAGIVSFERDVPHPDTSSGVDGNLYSNVASFGRLDLGSYVFWKDNRLYARLNGTRSSADDYETGHGDMVHSAYERWSLGATVGWMMDAESNLEISLNTSDGEASYADRAMDGVKFARENLALRFLKDLNGNSLERLEAQVYYNYIDHVMDNYSLRDFTSTGMMPNPAVSNPDRLTYGGKVLVKLNPVPTTRLTVGLDAQVNEHSLRKTMNETALPYEVMSRVDDASFKQSGLFGESKIELSDNWSLVFGGRVDFWSAKDKRRQIAVSMMGNLDNPTAGMSRSDVLPSGFLRMERQLHDNMGQVYAGVGYVSRFPDYWELFSKESETTLSAFETDPEKTLQLDLGWLVQRRNWSITVSAFATGYQDFILIQNAFPKAGMMGKTRSSLISRNVEASTMGLETSAIMTFDNGGYLSASASYVRGENDTDDLPLAQIPPLEGRIELGLKKETYALGLLTRVVGSQNRVAVNQGNIVGQDIGPSDGFAVFSIHGSYRLNRSFVVSAGVDNLADKNYAEHLSRTGSAVAGFVQTTRVNEPGRVIWLRGDFKF